MSRTFAALIHVTPAPTTTTESRAILRHLNQNHARVHEFVKVSGGGRGGQKATSTAAETSITTTAAPSVEPLDDSTASSSSYYATFRDSFRQGYMKFSVPVYNDVKPPRALDPYNLRGLQHRKPYPPPKIFHCILERHQPSSTAKHDLANKNKNNPYRGRFEVDHDDPLREILVGSGLQKNMARNLNVLRNGGPKGPESLRLAGEPWVSGSSRIPMDSLMKPWREANGLEHDTKEKESISYENDDWVDEIISAR